jgi:N-acyl homoserine lactone hydrolase
MKTPLFAALITFSWALSHAQAPQPQPINAEQGRPPPVSRPPGLAPLPRVSSPRLYVIDCGTLISNRPEEYNLARDEVADTNMPVPCFVVIHPKGLLLFDTGLSDRLVGRPVYENVVFGYAQIKFNTLKGQLADIGVAPGDITYLALSHSHFDHIGNANDYAGSIWLAQKAELDTMFGAHASPEMATNLALLAHARTVGFTGDLYHHAEERTLHRMPPEEQNTATPASRAMIEQFLTTQKAQLWIGHSTAFFRDAVKSPGWYE